MSNYFAQLDLLKLTGAKVSSADIDGKVMNVVVIPADVNGISIMADQNNRPSRAFLPVNMWQNNERFVAACREHHKGETDYNPPSHSVQVAYSKELQETLVNSVAENMRQDSRFDTMPQEELKKQALYEVRRHALLAYAYERKNREQQSFNGQAKPVSLGEPVIKTTPTQKTMEDDLPF